eukprot:CAMPEP_0170534036 /NCGR_PEP_ID=MMETSP0209-20121228/87751_1 /TAXON_ID=665100 ORGANISM="Litonotus pictus, Strain P1" /NCGR_SAMPLE_ID=MMETSP0209 /ASSEMBLY_ACC=CAM_ASM_000301 /LENGTH=200 /DNA_ID=CAMNT_0010832779 /DNA_START=356 /DNA_END=954 /DNA_ORIENTATION=-
MHKTEFNDPREYLDYILYTCKDPELFILIKEHFENLKNEFYYSFEDYLCLILEKKGKLALLRIKKEISYLPLLNLTNFSFLQTEDVIRNRIKEVQAMEEAFLNCERNQLRNFQETVQVVQNFNEFDFLKEYGKSYLARKYSFPNNQSSLSNDSNETNDSFPSKSSTDSSSMVCMKEENKRLSLSECHNILESIENYLNYA